jgi:hypothetical protein
MHVNNHSMPFGQPPFHVHSLWPAAYVACSYSVGERTLRAEELAGDVESLTSHDDDLLAIEELLGDGAGEATEQVALAVDDLGALSARGSLESSLCIGVDKRRGLARRPSATACARNMRLRVFGAYVQ